MTGFAGTDAVLLSNSSNGEGELYAYAATAMAEAVRGRPVTFVPYALAGWDAYAAKAGRAFAAFGAELTSAHLDADPVRAILDAEVVMVGGGNTFRLLDTLLQLGVVDELGERVRSGATTYLGASAGTSLAGPTIRTSNDMPIRHPATFDSLGVVPFQINAHYVDPDPRSTFRGETRDERLEEFLEDNDAMIFGLHEGGYLRITDDRSVLHGRGRLFTRDGTTDLADGYVLGLDDVAVPSFDVGGWSSPLAAAWPKPPPAAGPALTEPL